MKRVDMVEIEESFLVRKVSANGIRMRLKSL